MIGGDVIDTHKGSTILNAFKRRAVPRSVKQQRGLRRRKRRRRNR